MRRLSQQAAGRRWWAVRPRGRCRSGRLQQQHDQAGDSCAKALRAGCAAAGRRTAQRWEQPAGQQAYGSTASGPTGRVRARRAAVGRRSKRRSTAGGVRSCGEQREKPEGFLQLRSRKLLDYVTSVRLAHIVIPACLRCLRAAFGRLELEKLAVRRRLLDSRLAVGAQNSERVSALSSARGAGRRPAAAGSRPAIEGLC